MQERFVIRQHPYMLESQDVWFVEDTQTNRFRVPSMATNLYMRKETAIVVMRIMNMEWEHFLKQHPV